MWVGQARQMAGIDPRQNDYFFERAVALPVLTTCK
jgi:hypothetical protein